MRKLHNNGEPIDVDAYLPELVERLRGEEGLVAVYLYGSYGTKYQTPLSDVDLALVFRPEAVPDFDRHLALIGLVTDTLREEDVSVTLLNRAPSIFQYEVLATGRPLLVTDPVALADFTEHVLKIYGDFAPTWERFLKEYDQAMVERYG